MNVKDLRLRRVNRDRPEKIMLYIQLDDQDSDKYELNLTKHEIECLLAEIQDVVIPYSTSNKRRINRFS